MIASAAFSRTICLYSLDKDEYLNELYISACKNPHEERLCLARTGKKYYAVLRHSTKEVIPFLKETIIDAVGLKARRSSIPCSSRKRAKSGKIAFTTRTMTRW